MQWSSTKVLSSGAVAGRERPPIAQGGADCGTDVDIIMTVDLVQRLLQILRRLVS